eukprot:CAMPEP_0196209900 /NCGR_PEP_ID=MMETSP0912-20130531/9949_1 /TAXON_ID=49265 /ORGANISM="Thalassiosira rotula, Strain GSO102" /LENGTH=436 /DNA_ID=CAMNT_0041484891 /DNA_START=306 /DNA_END=1616 /DNA_ORIENTATION=+
MAMIKTYINSNIEFTSINPFLYFAPPPAPRQPFSTSLPRSSYPFPKISPISSHNPQTRMMMNTDFNDSIAHNISSVSDFDHTNNTKAGNANKENDKNNDTTKPSNLSSKLRPNKKKSVRFDDTKGGNITYTIDTVLRASEMSSKEKQIAWYNSNEFDQFKYEAARHAGIKIVRYDNTTEERTNQSHRFAMVGDFDDCSTVKDAASTSKNRSNVESASSSSGKAATVKKFYNENEYNDTHSSQGEAICKRGLGYHFSRNRKKSRAVTRSAVVTWQKMLRSDNNASSSSSNPKSQQNKLPILSETNSITGRKLVIGKMQLMLSLVSAKCSRVAREEARWRGDVDYRVAYPERQRDDAAAANCNRDDTMTYKKRSCDNNNDNNGDDAGVISGGKNARCKRQRTSSGNTGSGGCREAGDDAKLSLTTSIGCINGILRTEL